MLTFKPSSAGMICRWMNRTAIKDLRTQGQCRREAAALTRLPSPFARPDLLAYLCQICASFQARTSL